MCYRPWRINPFTVSSHLHHIDFGLRDYGTAQWDGGDVACDHKQGRNGSGRADGIVDERGQRNRDGVGSMGGDCGKCGAVRQDRQIGLESSLDAYIAELVTVFREVRRVLRDDGTCWINLGDSFASQGGIHKNGSYDGAVGRHMNGMPRQTGGLKPKDLMMVPARVALALQADGWYLRSDIIWHKPNPMPESVTDRPTSSHEHVFLLTKKSKYFYDAEAVKEPHARIWNETNVGADNWVNDPTMRSKKLRNGDSEGGGHYGLADTMPNPAGRNLRNVWTIATQPYSQAHFATFPPALVEPCIKAGTSEKGCCAACGAPWTRVTETISTKHPRAFRSGKYTHMPLGGSNSDHFDDPYTGTKKVFTGWQPGCTCNAGEPIPCTVLDPFMGAGTVALVADRLGRDSIGIELSATYAQMARDRISGDCPMFAEVVTT